MNHAQELKYLEDEVKRVLNEVDKQLVRCGGGGGRKEGGKGGRTLSLSSSVTARVLAKVTSRSNLTSGATATSEGIVTANESEKLTEKLEYAKARVRTMEVEQRQMEDRQEARVFLTIIKELQTRIKELEQQLLWSTGGRRITAETQLRDKYGDISRNEDDAILYGKEMQTRQHELADRGIELVVETQLKAEMVAEQVNQQTVQIRHIDKQLAEIDNELKRATKIIQRMSRKLITDKYVMCLIILVFIAVIVVVLLAVFKKHLHPRQETGF